MANYNHVTLIGNLTRDPEAKYTPKGVCIAQFGIAINRNYTTESGEKREEVTFIDVEAWARIAEVICEHCKKGDPIFIDGRLKLETWDDKQSGQKRSKLKVVCESFQFLNRRESGGQQHEPEPQRQQAQRQAPQRPPRPAADPDLDAMDSDIPF